MSRMRRSVTVLRMLRKLPAGSALWILLVLFLATTMWFTWRAYRNLEVRARASIGESLDTVLESTEHGVRQWFEGRLIEVTGLSGTLPVREAARELVWGPLDDAVLRTHPAQANFRDVIEPTIDHGDYSQGCILTADGIVVASTRPHFIGKPFSSRPHVMEGLREVFAGRTVMFSIADENEQDAPPSSAGHQGAASVLVLAPIVAEGGAIVAALSMRLNFSGSFSDVVHAARRRRGFEIYAFDEQARLYTSTRHDVVLSSGRSLPTTSPSGFASARQEPGIDLATSDVPKLSSKVRHPTRLAAEIRNNPHLRDFTGYRNILGQLVLGSWKWNHDLSIGLGVEIEEQEALSALSQTRGLLFFLIGMQGSVVLLSGLVLGGALFRVRRIRSVVRASTERRVLVRTRELREENTRLVKELEQRRATENELRSAHRTLEESAERLAKLSQTDALTNLANRRRFDEFVEREWRLRIRQQTKISLVLIDIDYFKLFNDRYGHRAGDDCLREIAVVISNAARRPGDLAARLAGEEFAVVLCDTDLEGAKAVAQQIRASVEGLAIDHEMTMVADTDVITVSVGVATKLAEPSSGPSVLLYHADEALFLAKQDGRNVVRTYEDCALLAQSSAGLRSASFATRVYDPLGRKGRSG